METNWLLWMANKNKPSNKVAVEDANQLARFYLCYYSMGIIYLYTILILINELAFFIYFYFLLLIENEKIW